MKKTILSLLMLLVVSLTAVAETIYSQELYEKAVMGDGEAMYQLSICYMNGFGVAVDYDRSDYWLERAAQEGQPNAVAAMTAVRGKTGLSDTKRRQLAAEEKRERERLERERRGGNTPRATGNQTFTVGGVSFTMVAVDGGTFTMGATSEQNEYDYYEKPAHSVTLSSYYIGQTEVTQELWEAVMGSSNPSRFKGAKHPVENVSWNDCQEFINKLNSMTGKNFRLPTEAEWEYAARGGNRSQHYKYSGSNTLSDVAWYNDNSGRTTHDVATKRANELGIYDMSGNVSEWCSGNWYHYDGSSTPYGSDRMFRGGGWDYHARNCRVSTRYVNAPDLRDINLGLRLAL